MISQLIGAFIVLLIGFSLIPIMSSQINNQITDAQANMTNGVSKTILGHTILIFCLVIVITAVTMAIKAFTNAGLLSGHEEIDYHEKYEEKKRGKQTYEEYVQERLSVERMMK